METIIKKQTDYNHNLIKNRLRKTILSVVFIVLATVLLLLLVNYKMKDLKVVLKLQEQANSFKGKKEQTQGVINQYQDVNLQFKKTFPAEREIADFVRTIEDIGDLSSEKTEVTFDSDLPYKDKNQYPYLNFTLKIKTDFDGFLFFLDKFEKIPYMTDIKLIQAQKLTNFKSAGDYIIKANLYVGEPFSAKKQT